MKQKELEIILQKIPPTPHPNPQLEQYQTPAPIAADILYTAYSLGDIQDKTILDLGCGTGIFAIGAKLLNANQVTGIDIDKQNIDLARIHAEQNHLQITFHTTPINTYETPADTTIMNPPFGAQKSNENADQHFLKKALQLSTTIYSIHIQKTLPFLKKYITTHNGEITHMKSYVFPIKALYSFHTHLKKDFEVLLLRTITSEKNNRY